MNYQEKQSGRMLFISDGISGGKAFGVFYRKPNGSLKRVKSPALPMCNTRDEAQDCLDRYAIAKKLARVEV